MIHQSRSASFAAAAAAAAAAILMLTLLVGTAPNSVQASFLPTSRPNQQSCSTQKTQNMIGLSSTFTRKKSILTPILQAGVVTDGLFPNFLDPRRRLESISTVEQDPYAVAARGDWRAYLDNSDNNNNNHGHSTGQVYYFNVVTGVSQWTRPSDFPVVQLTAAEQRQALKLQQKYRDQVAQHVEHQVVPTEKDQQSKNNNHWLVDGIQYACAKVSQAAVDVSVFSADHRPKTLQVEGTWKAYTDKTQNNAVYYYNTVTGESQWKPPTPTFPHIRSSISKRVVEAAPPMKRSSSISSSRSSGSGSTVGKSKDNDNDEKEHEVVGRHGDWRAYFDATDSCLVYYVNIKQGTSQWEAPPDFPAVTLRPAQLAKMAVKRQQVALWQESSSNAPSLVSWEGVWNAASSAATKIFNNPSPKQPQSPPEKKQQHKQQSSWNPFANAHETSEHKSSNFLQNMVTSMFQPKKQNMEDVLYYEVKKNFFMPDDEPVHDSSATRPVDRVSLEEKRLNDSRKRQANLRKCYDAVILDRSPTVSLTAIKRGGKSKDWYQYLDEL